VDVGAKPHVVGEVPAIMIRVLIDYDLIGSPVPAIAEGKVDGSDGEIETAKPESLSIAASNVPYMAFAEATGEVPVLPRMIQMIVGIIAAGIVADPSIVGVNMRSVGMAIFVDVFWWCRMLHGLGWSRSMRRNVAPADAVNRRRRGRRMLFLRESRNRTDQEQGKNS
jgi:hypothetical protein